MVKRNNIYAAFSALAMLMLIFDSKTALWGAREGINLCYRSLIPSLFPFLICSILITDAIKEIQNPRLQTLAAVCKVPEEACSTVITSFLCGYPAGAQNVAQLFRSGNICAAQAERMLSFCNNAGPAFIFGILGPLFSSPRTVFLLWFIQIVSAMMVAMVLPPAAGIWTAEHKRKPISMTDALSQTIRSMASICGWVILLRIIIAFLDKWVLFLLPDHDRIMICGFLELSNGCIQLGAVESEALRFILASALLSVGGVSVALQTVSVSEDLSHHLYFSGKILQGCFSVMISSLIQYILPISDRYHIKMLLPVVAMITMCCIFLLRFNKKRVVFSGRMLYNERNHANEVESCYFAKK